MPPRKKGAPAKAPKTKVQTSVKDEVEAALKWLKSNSTRKTREGMARYGIPSDNALGVTMSNLKVLAQRLGRNHELAAAIWETGVYEARMLASLIDEPGARHVRANGPLVPRLRQLGHLRHSVFCPF